MPDDSEDSGVRLFSARGVADVLSESLDHSVLSAVLMNSEGKSVVYAGESADRMEAVSAIVSSLAGHVRDQGLLMLDEDSSFYTIMDFEDGRICFGDVATLTLCLLAICDAPVGLLRSKMSSLREQLQEPLSEVFVSDT